MHLCACEDDPRAKIFVGNLDWETKEGIYNTFDRYLRGKPPPQQQQQKQANEQDNLAIFIRNLQLLFFCNVIAMQSMIKYLMLPYTQIQPSTLRSVPHPRDVACLFKV